MIQAEIENNLLRKLSGSDFDILRPSLRALSSRQGEEIYNPGDHVGTVYFPLGTTLVSFLVVMADGSGVETLMVGREGAVGGLVSQGRLPAYSRIMVQSGGQFLTLPVNDLELAKRRSTGLNGLFARYADCLMAQVFQAIACNAAHTIEQRTAKWIKASLDHSGDNVVRLTQDRLAAMLGVGRTYLSRVIKEFKADGSLSVKRGSMIVTSREGIERRSCQCNELVREHFETVLTGVYPAS